MTRIQARCQGPISTAEIRGNSGGDRRREPSDWAGDRRRLFGSVGCRWPAEPGEQTQEVCGRISGQWSNSAARQPIAIARNEMNLLLLLLNRGARRRGGGHSCRRYRRIGHRRLDRTRAGGPLPARPSRRDIDLGLRRAVRPRADRKNRIAGSLDPTVPASGLRSLFASKPDDSGGAASRARGVRAASRARPSHEDVASSLRRCLGLPVVAINLAVLVCCLGYIGWLSPIVLTAVVVFLILGATSYHLVVLRAMRYLLRRDEQDDLMKQFRGLTDGAKELKLFVVQFIFRMLFMRLCYDLDK